MLVTRGQALQTVKLKIRFKYRTREIIVDNSVLEMLSETTRKTVMDESIDDNQRFKTLIEELYWTRKLSIHKLAMKLNMKHEMTLWKIMRRLGVGVRDKVTAFQLAHIKYVKHDFDGDDAEKLKLWFFVHTDGSVIRDRQQLKVTLRTPDPYLAFLFRKLFAKYGYVGLAPYKNNHGCYIWQLRVLLLFSFKWFLEKEVPAHIDEGKLYEVLSVVINCEGTISAWKRTNTGTTEFAIAFYNEKVYVIEPLYQALIQLGYDVRMNRIPRGRMSGFGPYKSDYHRFVVYDKIHVKRLLEHLHSKLELYHKRLKACLIKYALSDPAKPVPWENIKPLYDEINCLYDEMLRESKGLAEALHPKWQAFKELWRSRRIDWKQYEEGRARLEAEAWRALEELKEKYDEVFSNLERRIEARFRARKPLKPIHKYWSTWSLILKFSIRNSGLL